MHSTLRKSLKFAGWSLGGVFVLLGIFIALLAFPGFLFAHKLEQGNLTVYSEEVLDGNVEPVLREIQERLAISEINDPALVHQLFFGDGAKMFGVLQEARLEIIHRTIGVKPSPTYNVSWPPYLSHIVTFDAPDFGQNALRRSAWPHQFDMTHVLTHEVTHSLVSARLGLANVPRLPMWKAEGYPEYVAMVANRSRPGYSLRASVTRVLASDLSWLRNARGDFEPMRYDCVGKSWLKDENDDSWHTCYYLARVLVEYLLDRKGMTFDQLMQPAVDESETLRELLGAYHAGNL